MTRPSTDINNRIKSHIKHDIKNIAALRHYRNSSLYRSLTRTLRVYNRLLVERLHARGFTDFAPSGV